MPLNCLVCADPLPAPAPAGRPRRYCSAACRRRAYHQRHRTGQQTPPAAPPPAAGAHAPEGAHEALLAAIVLIPLGAEGAYAATRFTHFPWHELLSGLREGRAAACAPGETRTP